MIASRTASDPNAAKARTSKSEKHLAFAEKHGELEHLLEWPPFGLKRRQ